MFKWQHPDVYFYFQEKDSEEWRPYFDSDSNLKLKKLMQDMISNFPQYRVAWEIDDSIGLELK